MEHSNVLSFSASARLIACPASRRMSKGVPNSSSAASELGTAAHELGEHCLRYGFEPSECIGLTFNNHVVDDGMVEAVNLYVGYVRSLEIKTGVKSLLEQRVTLSSLGRDDVFGTSDSILIHGDTLYITDYKHGFIPVEVVDNPQPIGYALATMDTFKLWGRITKVVATIVQPRKPHIDGPIRSHVYDALELRDVWWPKFYNAVIEGENPLTKTNPGKHCKYCPARGFCRSRVMMTLQNAYWGDPIDIMTDDEIEVLYSEVEQMKTNIEAIQGRAIEIARKGHKFEDYKLVDSITRYKCVDEDGLVDAAKKSGIDLDKIYVKKLKSMTEIKKHMNPQLAGQYFEKPEPKTTLAPMNDNRPAKRLAVFGPVPGV